MCRARRGGPRTPSRTSDANLDCAFVENALFLPRSLIEKIRQNITVVSQYRDYKNRDGQSWDRQFRDYCEIFFTVTANIVTANHMIVTAN